MITKTDVKIIKGIDKYISTLEEENEQLKLSLMTAYIPKR